VPWVRRHAQYPQIAAYDQTQGFDLVREEQRTHPRLYMLARKGERLDLSPWPGSGFRVGVADEQVSAQSGVPVARSVSRQIPVNAAAT
jgi:hypothetical protein